MRRVLLLGVLLALASAGAGCGEDTGGVIGTGDTTDATSSGSTTAPTSASGARLITPTPGLLNPLPAAIDSAALDPEGGLEVRFYGGVQECYGVDRVEVSESDTAVTVTVFTGGRPEAADRACIDIAELQAVQVALSQPLGTRPLVDGSTGGQVTIG